MDLIAIPAFADNLIWMLHDGRQAIVVDPGAAAPVADALRERGLRLAAILVTHHHADHIGGLRELSGLLGGPAAGAAPGRSQESPRPLGGTAPYPATGGCIFGPAHERMPIEVIKVSEGTRFDLLGLDVRVLDVPGHTAGHVAYVVTEAGKAPWLFCGDTLFSAGCGRLFEGTPVQMNESLGKLAALPGETRVCCAHEYTLANLRFARTVEPHNAALAAYEARCQALRAEGTWTLPSTIATEREVNPFLRAREPEVAASALAHGAASTAAPDVFATLREWKNTF
jgi:hydroxyacylglutathione hydrolase